MTRHRLPALDLTRVFLWDPTAHVITAVPLEPASWIILVNPSFLAPLFQRLARVNVEIVQRFAVPWFSVWMELCVRKPVSREFFLTITQITSAKDAQGKHLLGRQFRPEYRIKFFSNRCSELVAVPLLHLVIHDNNFWFFRPHTAYILPDGSSMPTRLPSLSKNEMYFPTPGISSGSPAIRPPMILPPASSTRFMPA